MQLLQIVFFCNKQNFLPKKQPELSDCFYVDFHLLFDDLQDLHGASLDADAAGDALGSGATNRSDHNLHGADLCALTAGGAELLVDHVDTGLGILGNCTSFTDLCALAALNAGHGLCTVALRNNTNAGQVLVKFFVKSVGASTDTLQASHALYILFNSKLFHTDRNPLFLIFIYAIIIQRFQNSNGNFKIPGKILIFHV